MPFGFGRKRGFPGLDQRGRARKRRGRGGLGPGGPPTNCICPQCGLVAPREPGIRCFQRRCPRCGSFMTRQFFRGE